MKGVVLLGTEPKVGKTYIAGLLISAIQRAGKNPGYFKCAATGVPSIEQSEAALLRSQCNLGQELNEMIPFTYKASGPIHLVSRKAKRYVSKSVIQERLGWNMATHQCLVIEGVGEVISPLIMEDDRVLMQEDIISQLKLNVILVVRMCQSALNQASLASIYLRNIGLNCVGIIINGYDPNNYAHQDAYNLISRFTQLPIIGTVQKGQRSLEITNVSIEDIFFDPSSLGVGDAPYYDDDNDVAVSDEGDDITF